MLNEKLTSLFQIMQQITRVKSQISESVRASGASENKFAGNSGK